MLSSPARSVAVVTTRLGRNPSSRIPRALGLKGAVRLEITRHCRLIHLAQDILPAHADQRIAGEGERARIPINDAPAAFEGVLARRDGARVRTISLGSIQDAVVAERRAARRRRARATHRIRRGHRLEQRRRPPLLGIARIVADGGNDQEIARPCRRHVGQAHRFGAIALELFRS